MIGEIEAKGVRGTLLDEGKTKRVFLCLSKPGSGIFESKDNITAGDGKKRDVLEGKGALATRTTCNVFRFLDRFGIPLAFESQVDATSFQARLCKMLPWEVVVRVEAHGSYCKRHPEIIRGVSFSESVIEFFLKTKNRKWGHRDLPCDDPLAIFENECVRFYEPSKPLSAQAPFWTLSWQEAEKEFGTLKYLRHMSEVAWYSFAALENAWRYVGGKLVDFKVEFGIGPDGKVVLADVIDNDSWRVIVEGDYIDKQGYRDGHDLARVLSNYRRVADLTDRFSSMQF